MFETKKTLIVVYKDELLVNQLRKMVEAHDDTENGIIGTTDDSINIVAWTEKVWLGNKKAGNLQGKVLFLDEIKDTDKLIPVLDNKFDEYGVKFGWAGNQAVLYVTPKELADRKKYDAFLEKLSAYSPPDILKAPKDNDAAAEFGYAETEAADAPAEESTETVTATAGSENDEIPSSDNEERKKPKLFRVVQKAFSSGADAIGKAGSQVAVKSEEVFRNKALMKRQMLFYGVVKLYHGAKDDEGHLHGLEEFMNQ